MSEEVDFDGYLYKRPGSAKKTFGNKYWNYYYINLIGGSLHYYSDPEDPDPKGTIDLNGLKYSSEIRKPEKKDAKKTDNNAEEISYIIRIAGDKKEFEFEAEDEEDWKQWCSAIEKNMNAKHSPPLKKEKRISRAKEWAQKAKRNVVGKAIISPLGKKAIKAKAPEEVINLINAVKHIVEKESKSSKKASEVEENIFKLGVKCFFLVEANKISFEDLLAADKPLRTGLEMLSVCHDHAKYSRAIDEQGLRKKFAEASKQLHDASDILSKLVEPHLKPKNVAKISQTVEYFANVDRLYNIFTDSTLDDDLLELITASEHYTQFHFYPEEFKKGSGKKEKD